MKKSPIMYDVFKSAIGMLSSSVPSKASDYKERVAVRSHSERGSSPALHVAPRQLSPDPSLGVQVVKVSQPASCWTSSEHVDRGAVGDHAVEGPLT